jgi:uncharacterized protein YraI
MSFSPIEILNTARRAVPAVDFALGVAGVAAAASIVISFNGNGRTPVIIFGGMLVAMVLLLVFSRLLQLENQALVMAAVVLVWSTVLFFVTFLLLTASAFVFHTPHDWAVFIGAAEAQAEPKAEQPICLRGVGQVMAFSCGHGDGIHIVANVRWNDSDLGLTVRKTPTIDDISVGIIPPNASHLLVGTCEDEWCRVQCGGLKGWSRARFLALESNAFRKVTNVPQNDPQGLPILNGPDGSCDTIGSLAYNGRNVITHICERSPNNSSNWCRITYGVRMSGWVKRENLDEQD